MVGLISVLTRSGPTASLTPFSPIRASRGRLKAIDLLKANDYKGVEGMTRPPDIIVVLDKTDLLGEPHRLKIPVRPALESRRTPLKG